MSASENTAHSSRVHAWLSAQPAWRRFGLAALAGAVATLGHAPFQLALLYAIAIVTLVWLLDVSAARAGRLKSAFATGFFFALGHFASGIYWVSSAFMVDAEAWGPIWGVPATLGLAAFLALYWGLGCTLAMLLWTRDVRRLPWFAVCLFATEFLRGHFPFGGFPWLLPGYVWTPGEPISQIASVVGIYGLSLLTLLMAAAPAAIADGGASAGRRFAPTLIAALMVGLAFGWGAQRMSRAPVELPGAQAVVRVADAGLSQAEKWRARPDQEWRVLQRYLEATGAPADSRAQVVLWPEGAIPVVNFFTLENPEFLNALGQGLGDRVLITGLSRREMRSGKLVYFNSAAVIDGVSGQPRLSQTYDKHVLVPFGEYIPLWSLISGFNIAPLQRIGAGFEAGAPPTRLVVPDAPPVVVLICYEAIFPNLIPRGAERPGWIASVTNDAWFGKGTGPWQHYAMARYRAIEEGLPLARAASGGVSAIVDAYGREVAATQGRDSHAEAQLPPSLGETLFARWGNVFLALLLVIAVLLRFLLPAQRRQDQQS
jgi:apolipoprotein N-acyltransferase